MAIRPVQALRANKRDEQKVINVALAEIRDEVRSKDWDVKAAAVLKLTYVSLAHPGRFPSADLWLPSTARDARTSYPHTARLSRS